MNKKENTIDDSERYIQLATDIKYSNYNRNIYNTKAFNLLKNKRNDSLNREQLFRVARVYNDINEREEFKKVVITILDRSTNNGNQIHFSKACNYLGSYYKNKSVLDSAFIFYNKSIKFLCKYKDYKSLTNSLLHVAFIQFVEGKYMECEVASIDALRYAELISDKDYEYNALIMLANSLSERGDYGNSLKRNVQAYRLLDENDPTDRRNIQLSLNNIGNAYKSLENFSESIHYFVLALAGKEKPKEEESLILYATLLDNLAYSKFKIKEYHDVLPLYLKALAIRKEIGYSHDIITTNIHLSEYYWAVTNDTLKAQKLANEAFKIGLSSKLPHYTLEALKHLILIDQKNTPTYTQLYVKINDSLQLEERRNRNKFARIAYETDEIIKEKDIAVRQKQLVSGVSSGVGVIILLLFIIKYQRDKQKELSYFHEQQKTTESIYRLIHDRQRKIDEGRQAEKKRIALELHDGVMNKLTSTRLNLFILKKSRNSQTINRCLDFIKDIQSIEVEIGLVAQDLNKDVFSDGNSFNIMLASLLEGFKEITECNIHHQIDKTIDWENLEPAMKMNLYRVIQEAIHNCIKYANAQNIYITILKKAKTISIKLVDDGIGFDKKQINPGAGIKNMKDRIESLSGKIHIRAKKDSGTSISITLSIVES